MHYALTPSGRTKARSLGRIRLTVLAALVSGLFINTDAIAATTGFQAPTIEKEIGALTAQGYVVETRAPGSSGVFPTGVSDEAILTTFRQTGSRQATADLLGMSRGGVRHRLARMASTGLSL